MSESNGKSEWADRINLIREKIDGNRDKIFSASAGVDAEQYVALFMQAIGRQPKLAQCSLASLTVALTDSAVLGLPINSVEGDGYLVPRECSYKDENNNWQKKWVAQFQAGYRGKLKLAYESPLIAGITVEVVREGDYFEVMLGTEQTITHEPRGGTIITHVYAVVWLTSGCRRCVVWTKEAIDEHRGRFSPPPRSGKDRSAWATNWPTMAKKTVLLDLLKFAPVSDRARRVMQAEEYADAGQPVRSATLQSGDTLTTDDLDELAGDEGDEPTAEEAAALDAQAIAESNA